MSNVKQVKIGKAKFNVTQAPADKQKLLLSLLGAKLALNSALANVEKIDVDIMFGALLTLPENEFDVIAQIVLYKTIKDGGETIVDIGDFQNNTTEYYLLVAHAVEVNLGDFFTYLDAANKKAREAEKKV